MIEGRWRDVPTSYLAFGLFLGAVVLAGALSGFARVGVIPWGGALIARSLDEPDVALVVIAFLGVGAGALIELHVVPRAGTAELLDDRVVIRKFLQGRERVVSLAWSDVAWFDDRSSDYVRLVRRGEGWAWLSRSTIPTPDEAARTAVLEALAARGIVRRGGA